MVKITFSVLDFFTLILFLAIKIRYDVSKTWNLQFHVNLSPTAKGT